MLHPPEGKYGGVEGACTTSMIHFPEGKKEGGEGMISVLQSSEGKGGDNRRYSIV